MSLRLQSLNQKTLTDYHRCNGVFSRIRFLIFLFDLNFDFLLILIVPWQDKWDFRRILQVGGTCFPLGNVCMQNNSISYDNLNHSSRKRLRLQIRMKSRYKSKNKGQKNPWSKTPCASVRSVSFFWPSFCSRRLTERIIARLIYIHIPIIYIVDR